MGAIPATIIEAAPAKLNLALHVRRRRADGYHDLETLFAFCRDGDVVTLADADRDTLVITGPFAGALGGPAESAILPDPLAPPSPQGGASGPCFDQLSTNGGVQRDRERGGPETLALRPEAVALVAGSAIGSPSPFASEDRGAATGRPHLGPGLRRGDGGGEGSWPVDNLVVRAADAFRAAFGAGQRCAIILEKNLPIASGIGGGSADAAATLRALARRHGVAPDDGRLVAVAAALGADVPACLAGRTAFGTGKGDSLAPLGGWAGTPVLLVNPGVAVPTGPVFAGWDGVDRGPLDPADPLAGRNDLEPPARAIAPVIGEVVALLDAQAGVTMARMSGSGATCFALFDTPEARDAADATVAAHAPGWWRLATVLA